MSALQTPPNAMRHRRRDDQLPSRRRAYVRRAARRGRRAAQSALGRTGPCRGGGFRPLPHRHPRRPRRLAGQADPALRPRSRGRRHRRAVGPGSRRSRWATVSRCRGSATRAGTAATASPAGRRSAVTEEHRLLDRRRLRASTPSADARYVVPVPRGVDPLDAAPLTCAGVTTYKAVKVAGTRPSDLVAVFGVGGLGHLAVQYARDRRSACRRRRRGRREARSWPRLGADFTVNAAEEDPVAAIQKLGGADRRSRSPSRRPRSSRLTARCAAAARWCSSPSPPRTRDAADLRDRAQRHHRDRIDRRNA